MSEPRAYTAEEVTDIFLEHLRRTARYWAGLPEQTPLQKCEGVVFSILAMLDGDAMGLPAIDLVLHPHEEDKEFHRSQGSNWFEPGMAFNANVALHEIVYRSKGAPDGNA